MECKFYVGQKVVCVDADSPGSDGSTARWQIGEEIVNSQTYTVTSVHLGPSGEPTLWLKEVSRCALAKLRWGVKVGYRASRFRPLVETKTDISALKEIVRKVFDKTPETVDA